MRFSLTFATALAASGALAITPEQLIGAPRRGAAVPSPNGKVALFDESQYSFEEEGRTVAWKLLNLETGEIKESGFNTSEINEIVWIPGSETGIVYINGTNENIPGGVSIWVGDINDPSGSELVAELNAPFSGLKVANSTSGDLKFLVNALAYPNGTAFNPEFAATPKHTGRLYENIYPRHWDHWLTKERYAVFAGTLQSKSKYSLADNSLRNILQGIEYTATRPETPIQPFGGSGDYDISPDGETYAFITKAPHLNKANYTASYVYVGPIDGSANATAFNGPDSEASKAGHKGASGSPTFSPDSKKLAYVQQDEDYYESDRWQLYVVDVKNDGGKVSVSNLKEASKSWDRSVSAIKWAPDSKSIFVDGEDYGRVRAFNFPLSEKEDFQPKNLTGTTSITDFFVLPDSSLLVSASAAWTSRDFYTLSPKGEQKVLFSATEKDEELSGLGPHTYSEFFYKGAAGVELHALVVKPSNFKEGEKYPLAYVIHGGPQGANNNAWSTRWNYQVWADQGYVVVAPNPTGSTGFGQKLTDDIQGEWGSLPYEDVVFGWQYIKKNLDFVDTENGICAGASYGGFMTNWIQSHELGREFKALVTHDGISQTLGAYASEELWFIRHDFNGTIYDEGSTYKKFNPFDHIANWSTPQFVIHNTLDYRLPESDGLALFNVLQSKGVPSRFLNFPDENHWVLNPQNSLFWHQEIFNWINHYSKGEPLDTVPIGE
ncbi:hypothetical protein BU24DRAFT_400960 [Aaosphaeria arxii CBS 175.79]|uniref:Dipeptidyl-peptidase V n=1 Tax=Aaosphaeria arxii CBS 175.79 TaxID=1450172 RepID=A0A6A5XBD6_9PLEO|nr:uncharacterized protein BU24DRAFT_400960 [Aaosphaeria arxii CBS 175.79]KAF2010213.1 hypothetical protein BU24DRAFT_400960 [Aaosphaeria arxii CBS 175.79]